MPDITKCAGNNCVKKDICYRYTSEASDYQSYFTVEPFNKESKQFFCEMFWLDKNKRCGNL